jgi:hyaluronoglucosaminidase
LHCSVSVVRLCRSGILDKADRLVSNRRQGFYKIMSEFLCGVIEGFYGRAWSWEARAETIDFLQREKFNSYIYAPKSDRQLRRAWREQYAAAEFEKLLALREHCRQRGIQFGIGFSPWGLQSEYSADDRAKLQKKFQQLNQLDCDVLCILFDDMPGAIESLAQRQAAIVADIASFSNARRLAMCPTYYSFDPQLEKLFGAMPADYLQTLGTLLPESVDIFWTGSLVLSPGYSHTDINAIAEKIRRKPLLWDNYPVNDGRKISRFLHVLPARERPAQLRDWCSGHLANPMNQAFLSQLPLASLAHSYRVGESYCAETFWNENIVALVGVELAQLLQRDAQRFQTQGLDAIVDTERQALIADYIRINHPAAREVIEWLQEQYRFDPECLND